MADNGSRKRGIMKLIHNAQVTSLQKQNQDNPQEMNVYERYLVRGVGVPALLLLGAGLILVAVISLPILIGIVTIYHTPQAIFFPPLESGDTVYSVTTEYVEAFNQEVGELVEAHAEHDEGKVVYVSETDNYYDIICVYMVRYGIGETATLINDTSRERIKTIVNDMCTYATESVTESLPNADGTASEKNVLCVNVQLKSYKDMVETYAFDEKEVELLEEMLDTFHKGEEGGSE